MKSLSVLIKNHRRNRENAKTTAVGLEGHNHATIRRIRRSKKQEGIQQLAHLVRTKMTSNQDKYRSEM